MRALGLQLTAACLSHGLDMTDGLADGHFQISEVDWLGEEIERSAIHRGANVAHVAVGRDDDGRFPVLGLLQLLQQ